MIRKNKNENNRQLSLVPRLGKKSMVHTVYTCFFESLGTRVGSDLITVQCQDLAMSHDHTPLLAIDYTKVLYKV